MRSVTFFWANSSGIGPFYSIERNFFGNHRTDPVFEIESLLSIESFRDLTSLSKIGQSQKKVKKNEWNKRVEWADPVQCKKNPPNALLHILFSSYYI